MRGGRKINFVTTDLLNALVSFKKNKMINTIMLFQHQIS